MAVKSCLGICLLIFFQVANNGNSVQGYPDHQDHHDQHNQDHHDQHNHEHNDHTTRDNSGTNPVADAAVDGVDLGLSLLAQTFMGVRRPHTVKCPSSCEDASHCLATGRWCNEHEFCEIRKHAHHYTDQCRQLGLIGYCTNKEKGFNSCLTHSPCTVACCKNQTCVGK